MQVVQPDSLIGHVEKLGRRVDLLIKGAGVGQDRSDGPGGELLGVSWSVGRQAKLLSCEFLDALDDCNAAHALDSIARIRSNSGFWGFGIVGLSLLRTVRKGIPPGGRLEGLYV